MIYNKGFPKCVQFRKLPLIIVNVNHFGLSCKWVMLPVNPFETVTVSKAYINTID